MARVAIFLRLRKAMPIDGALMGTISVGGGAGGVSMGSVMGAGESWDSEGSMTPTAPQGCTAKPSASTTRNHATNADTARGTWLA